MKNIYKILMTVVAALCAVSCDFLDIVPDEAATEKDAFEDVSAAQRYMYSCYAYLPDSRNGAASLDFMTGDEVVTAFEHETFAHFPKGNYTASNPVISYWDTFFQGLRQCYIMLNNIDNVPSLKPELKADYVAQTKFLIAYYHFLLCRCYGSIILIKEELKINTRPENYLGRTPYDECVTFICNLFDEAAAGLPATRTVREYGLATSVVAKAFKAKMLLYAASPLFNGNARFYSDFTDKDGVLLMPTEVDPTKWIKARDALQEAITAAENAGHELYTSTEYNSGNAFPDDPTQRCLRYNIIDAGNKEILWADSRGEGYYGLQNKSLPYSVNSAWNGVAPTLSMLERFYTKRGLPIKEDPQYAYTQRWNVVDIKDDKARYDAEPSIGAETFGFNFDREPRYYAWVAFQGGFYEIMSSSSSGAYEDDKSYQKYSDATLGKGKLVCDFVTGGNCSRNAATGSSRNNDYSPTGFLNKKGVEPSYEVESDVKVPIDYPWPIMRLAELYLSYAEACVETNDLDIAKTYLNRVRDRAGIPDVETSWNGVAALTQDKLRQIVRTERMIELYLENNNFWDMRRWLLAETYFNQSARGMNIDADDLNQFSQPTEVVFVRKFESPTQYLLPIPIDDINNNEHVVQNPGY